MSLAGSRRWITIAAVALAVLASSHGILEAFFSKRLMAGHDTSAYAMFLVAIHDNIRHGVLVPLWNQFTRYGYGEPQLEFRPPVQSYLSEISYLFTGNHFTALYPPLLLFLIAAALGMYLLAKRILELLGEKEDGSWMPLLAAVGYVTSPYFLRDIYVRGALSEASCFAVFPWLGLAFIRVARFPNARNLAIAALAYFALVTSHAAIHMFTAPFIALMLFVYRSRLKNPLYPMAALVLGALASSFSWMPALLENGFVKSALLAVDFEAYPGHFVRLDQLIHTWPGEGNIPYSIGLFGWFGLGWAAWRWSGPRFLGLPRGNAELWRFCLLLFGCSVACVYFLHRVSAFWYEAFPLLQIMTFPWRFLTLITLFTSLLAALAAHSAFTRNWQWAALAIALIALGASEAFSPGYHAMAAEEYTGPIIAAKGVGFEKPYSTPSTAGVMPRTMAENAVEFIQGRGEAQCTRRSPVLMECDAMAVLNSTIRFNTFDYPNWRTYVDGKPATTASRDPLMGTLRVALAPGKHLVQWRLEDTAVRLSTKIISLLTLLGLLALTFGIRPRARRSLP